MDEDKQPEGVISPEQAGNGLNDRHRNISTASVGDRELYAWGSNKETGGNHNLALFEEPSMPFFSSYLKAHITPGPLERAQSSSHGGHGGKADLGVLLGVYLPTIQHILGVTMFIRLFWLVGIAGLGQTFLLLFLCCFCTFLTCISISAVATNGVVESGGAYFMISRNLGPEFGSAVGILFYLANTVATSMYLVGGVEILLLYIFPGITFGGVEGQHDTTILGAMTNSLRFYSTILLLLEFAIVAMGVKFVQMLAPVSLLCVILSILACYAGGITKTIYPDSGQYVCMFNDRLLQSSAVLNDSLPLEEICDYCNMNNTALAKIVCGGECNSSSINSGFQCINGFPGFNGGKTILSNLGANYVSKFESARGVPANVKTDVYQDVRTTFFVLLAIYFPAVTGIFTGANMSGDLKNPQASIPAGTIAANLTTSFVYFSLAFIFGGAIDNAVLRDKNGQSIGGQMVVALLSWPSPWVLLLGSFLSTFGAALQCLCSAPRLLQAIAKDEVIPLLSPFKKVTANNEPFLGLILTTIIAEIAILMGSMDTIAAVVDFFFLMCYAFVNIICTLHSLLGAPNWRPRFKYYHWFLSLLGAVLCFFIMFSTHWDYAIVACLLCLVIYKYVEWKGAKKEWGDGIRGLALTTAQYSLMKIEDKEPHPKNWRPQLLLLLSMQWSKEIIDVRYLNLLNLASQLKAGKGLTVVTAFLKGDPTSPDDKKKGEQVKARMDFDMNQVRLRGFAKTLVHSEDQIQGSMSTLVQSVGLGGLKPNTMLISWPVHDREEDMTEYNTFIEKVHAASINDMAIVVAKGIIDFPVLFESSDSSLSFRIALEYIDDLRLLFNAKCSGLEAWQIVSYAISVCFFIAWFKRIIRSNEPPLVQLKKSVFSLLRSLPWVRRKLEADLAKAQVEIEDEVHQYDHMREFYKFLPERCMDAEEILSDGRRYAMMGERRYMQHYDPQTRDEDMKLSVKLFDMFSHTDPHRSDAFPGVRKMEAEILKMTCAMFHGGKDACGVVAGGGTEAMMLACLAYRNRSRAKGQWRAEIVAPSTAHPALDKAAAFFDMIIKRVPVSETDDRADVGAMKRAIGPRTCMIIASAPNHITGTVDPIEKLAKLAQRYHIPLHVDCTLGGFVLPFMEYADYAVPAFDFRLPGVTSISADLHRYGQCPGRLSVLMYREPVFLRHQFFTNSEWPGGCYATPTMSGGRDGGAVATSWATMLRKGRDGYINACQRIVEGTRTLAYRLQEMEGITLKGSADLCVVSFTTDSDVNVYNLVDVMVKKGWHVDPLLSPIAARVPITLSMCEDGVIDHFMEDLDVTYSNLKSLDKPEKLGTTASFYQMLRKVHDKTLVDELSLIRLSAHYSIPSPVERRSLRTLSVEGRKLSMLGTTGEVGKKLEDLRRGYQREKETKKEPAALESEK